MNEDINIEIAAAEQEAVRRDERARKWSRLYQETGHPDYLRYAERWEGRAASARQVAGHLRQVRMMLQRRKRS